LECLCTCEFFLCNCYHKKKKKAVSLLAVTNPSDLAKSFRLYFLPEPAYLNWRKNKNKIKILQKSFLLFFSDYWNLFSNYLKFRVSSTSVLKPCPFFGFIKRGHRSFQGAGSSDPGYFSNDKVPQVWKLEQIKVVFLFWKKNYL
jgi:hypothetical protein